MHTQDLSCLARLIRYYILRASTQAGSGHPTSSLSATDLMTVLWFGLDSPKSRYYRDEGGGFYHFDFAHPDNPANDRLVFSKGHATPLYYSLFLAAGVITPEEIMTLRKFDSNLEGHPTPRFRFTEAATGSLGQGLSVGVGLALGARMIYDLRFTNKEKKSEIHKSPFINHKSLPRVYVLLGDGEMAEGSTWEAINIAGYYKLGNLVAIVDVNRLGQSQATMLGWDTKTYQQRFKAFGWDTIVIDGHDFSQITRAFKEATKTPRGWPTSWAEGHFVGRRPNGLPRGGGTRKPFAIIAKTVKGKGVSFLENREGWHGKPLKPDELEKALKELGKVDLSIRSQVARPVLSAPSPKLLKSPKSLKLEYQKGQEVATRRAYGTALARLGEVYPQLVVLDAEVKNSTYAEDFAKVFPDRYFEMFIAEQNMVGTAVGLARLGFIPFASSFACFLTRGYDQIRMAALSQANVKFCGSHAGVSIGEDGPSQMGLEDLAMFRAVHGSTVLYPADAVAAEKLVEEMIKTKGICYMRTSRPATPVIYTNDEKFPIGGCKIHKIKNQISPPKADQPMAENIKNTDQKSKILIIAAGVTLFESLKAQQELAKEGIEATVVDCYSIKPLDVKTLRALTSTPGVEHAVITVEDHWFEGGLGDAVADALFNTPIHPHFPDHPYHPMKFRFHKLAVSKMPRSGKPAELLAYEGIDSASIVATVKHLI